MEPKVGSIGEGSIKEGFMRVVDFDPCHRCQLELPLQEPRSGDSSWIVVCPPPSDLSSLHEAGVNIRAGNQLFIRSVPAFVNSSRSKKRVNVQFCLRLGPVLVADKVSLGAADVIKRQLFGSGL